MSKSLWSFIEKLEHAGELIRIKEFVDPELEITEITDRFSKLDGGGKALLFENTGTDFPVLTNTFGSLKRMCMALGTDNLDTFGTEINALFKQISSDNQSIFDKIKLIPLLGKVASWMPKSISGRGLCQDVIIRDPDLSVLPILKCWPADGGRFVTLPLVHTLDPVTGIRNLGMYRMQIFGKDLTGMHWHRHKTGARHYEEYKKLRKRMPVVVALGGDPVYTYAATAPLPDQIDEYMLAGFIRKKRVELVKCITQDLEVPKDVDIVIEGYVDPFEELIWEGPFGDHTGYYSLEDWYPKFHVTCITHKQKAVYPATIVGIPPQEDAWIANATERIFLVPMKFSFVPEIEDIDLPPAGVAHNLALISIDKRYPGQGLKVINSLWGAGQMMFNKVMVVTDKETDVHNYKSLFKHLLTVIQTPDDLMFSKGPLDILDHSSDRFAYGGKLGIDATNKYPEEQGELPIPTTIPVDIDISQLLGKYPGIYQISDTLLKDNLPVVLFSVKDDCKKNIREVFDDLADEEILQGIKLFVCYDQSVDLNNYFLCTWLAFSNIDPVRDCKIIYVNSQLSVFVDAVAKTSYSHNFKRPWPNIVVSSPTTIKKIDNSWNQYFSEKLIPSPSLNYQIFNKTFSAVADENKSQ
jgi:4-hydroxy-3-polyprenylbenzoate decarboxylase